MSTDLRAEMASFFKPPKSRTLEISSSQNATSNVEKRDFLKDGYRKSNQSLVIKVHRLEAELRRSHKIIEDLRSENAMLRKKICDTELLDSNERIEALVEERIKRKMDQLSFISSRTVAHLQKAALNLKEAFEDFGVLVGTSRSPPGRDVSDSKRTTLSSEGEPSLAAVAESPPLVIRGWVCDNMENKENRGTSLEDETPARTLSSRKQPRRSELFRPGQRDVQEIDESTPLAIPELSPLRGSPTPTSTPLVAAKRAFYETPAVPMVECDTVRRKRTATLKIKSLVEPKLNNKLRRPGRNDEPHPFISSLY